MEIIYASPGFNYSKKAGKLTRQRKREIRQVVNKLNKPDGVYNIFLSKGFKAVYKTLEAACVTALACSIAKGEPSASAAVGSGLMVVSDTARSILAKNRLPGLLNEAHQQGVKTAKELKFAAAKHINLNGDLLAPIVRACSKKNITELAVKIAHRK